MPNTPEAQALMQKLMEEEGLSEEEAYREADRIQSDRGRYPEAPPDLPEPYRTTIRGIRDLERKKAENKFWERRYNPTAQRRRDERDY